MTTCHMCAEDVGAHDAVCPHCGFLLRTPAAPPSAPSAPTNQPPGSSSAAAPTGGVPPTPSPSGGSQWVVPGALAVALVLALVVKFAWWDRRWQGTAEACEVVSALTALHPGSEELERTERAYFAGARDARTRFTRDLARTVSQQQDQGDLRTRGLPSATVEQVYAAALQAQGVAPGAAHATFVEHRREILRAVGVTVGDYLTIEERKALRYAASACRSNIAAADAPAANAAQPSVAAPLPTPPAAPPQPPAIPPPAAPPPTVVPPAPVLERLVPTSTTASSFMSNGRDQYAPARAFDGDPATTWTEDARGPGDGEWLQARFAGPQLVQRVRITTGWNHTSPRGTDLFTGNSHLRRVRLVLGPNTAIERDVGADEREVVFDGLDAETSTVRIEAVSVWPGTRWADLCIGEVVIEGEPLANGPVAVLATEEARAP